MNGGFLRQYGNLLAALAAVIILAHFFAIALPSAGTISQTNTKINETQRTQIALEQRIKALGDLSALATNQPADYSRLLVALPAAPEVSEIYTALEALSGRAGLDLALITPSKPTKDRVPLEVTVRGPFERIVDFLTYLNQNLRPAEVETLSIASAKAQDQVILTATIKVNFLYAPTPGQAESSASKGGQ